MKQTLQRVVSYVRAHQIVFWMSAILCALMIEAAYLYTQHQKYQQIIDSM